MKKLIAIILALVMVLSLAACGSNNADAPAADAPAADAPVAEAPTAPADLPEDEPQDAPADEPVAVMTYAEYAAAELDTPVVIDCYVQANQGWWFDSDAGHGKLTVYAADADGAYFLYELNVAEEDAAKFTPGTKIRVTGYKGMWDGQVEVMDGTYEFVEGDTYVAEPIDGNALLGSADMINYMNQLASFKGMTLESKTYKNDGGDDIWLSFSNNGVSCSFTVEVYLTGTDSDVYTTVDAMEIGDVADIEAFLYWYQDAADCHIISITPAA